jgi:preprotein translocase subunit SecE
LTVCYEQTFKIGETILAAKDKKAAKESGTKITRVTATDTKAEKPAKKPAATPKTKKAAPAPAEAATKDKNGAFGRLGTPFAAMGRYFKGAWYELRQVRWPTRRATWGLTGAMLVFTAFFVVLILLLDALFKYLFELMLG